MQKNTSPPLKTGTEQCDQAGRDFSARAALSNARVPEPMPEPLPTPLLAETFAAARQAGVPVRECWRKKGRAMRSRTSQSA